MSSSWSTSFLLECACLAFKAVNFAAYSVTIHQTSANIWKLNMNVESGQCFSVLNPTAIYEHCQWCPIVHKLSLLANLPLRDSHPQPLGHKYNVLSTELNTSWKMLRWSRHHSGRIKCSYYLYNLSCVILNYFYSLFWHIIPCMYRQIFHCHRFQNIKWLLI